MVVGSHIHVNDNEQRRIYNMNKLKQSKIIAIALWMHMSIKMLWIANYITEEIRCLAYFVKKIFFMAPIKQSRCSLARPTAAELSHRQKCVESAQCLFSLVNIHRSYLTDLKYMFIFYFFNLYAVTLLNIRCVQEPKTFLCAFVIRLSFFSFI